VKETTTPTGRPPRRLAITLAGALTLAWAAVAVAQPPFHHYAPARGYPRMAPPRGAWGAPPAGRGAPWGGPPIRDYGPPARTYRPTSAPPPGGGYAVGDRWYAGPPVGYAPPAPRATAGGWRRGGYLPPAYQQFVVQNPAAFHLRRPPSGYNWVQVGNQYLLVSSGTGLIFDAAPGY